MALHFSRVWLRSTRNAFFSRNPGSISRCHFILGNEACDCDSVISALIWGFCKQYQQLKGDDDPCLIVPVVSCRRSDWPLRREAKYLLDTCCDNDGGDWASDLVFVDDVVNEFKKEEEDLQVTSSSSSSRFVPPYHTITLTDHNAMKGILAPYVSKGKIVVTEIVDHHYDALQHTDTCPLASPQRLIDFDPVSMSGVGSSCTLVGKAILEEMTKTNSSTASTGTRRSTADLAVARLLLSVILLDTVALDPAAGRTKPLDVQVADELNALLRIQGGSGGSSSSSTSSSSSGSSSNNNDSNNNSSSSTSAGVDYQKTFQTLMGLRSDPSFWQSLSVTQALGYDYKAFSYTSTSTSPPSSSPPFSSSSSSTSASTIRFGSSTFMVPLVDFLSGWKANQRQEEEQSVQGSGATSSSTTATTTSSCTTLIPLDPKRLQEASVFLGSDVDETTGKELDFEILLSTSPYVPIQRSLAFITRRNGPEHSSEKVRLVDELITCLQEDGRLGLLQEIASFADADSSSDESGSKTNVYARVFHQGNNKASRKQVVPVILDILGKLRKCTAIAEVR